MVLRKLEARIETRSFPSACITRMHYNGQTPQPERVLRFSSFPSINSIFRHLQVPPPTQHNRSRTTIIFRLIRRVYNIGNSRLGAQYYYPEIIVLTAFWRANLNLKTAFYNSRE